FGSTVCYGWIQQQTQVYSASGSITRTITPVSGDGGMFVISWSNGGTFQWVAQSTSAGSSYPGGGYVASSGEIAFNVQSGANFAMTGSNNVQVSRSSPGLYNIMYAVKLKRDGTVAWVAKLQNSALSSFVPQASAVSSVDGRVAVGGNIFCDSLLQVYNLQDQLVKTQSMDLPGKGCSFAVVYDSSGTMLNTFFWYGSGSSTGVAGLVFDTSSSLYVKCTYGAFSLSIQGADGTGIQATLPLNLPCFVVKFSSTGAYLWLNQFTWPGTQTNAFDELWISPSGLLSYSIG
ncbi:hypothetical protein MIR68_001944, partial [Amoeboaphelidium protococcarum]